VNLYFFLEGRRTEPRVYRAWIGHVFPHLTEAKVIADMRQDNYLLVSGDGYPQCLNRIDGILEDIERHGGVDHFFVCLDAEEEPPEVKLGEIESYLADKNPAVTCHAVIHNCCIETWFLGNRRMMRRNPQSQRLRQWKAFYDVSLGCPELMGVPSGYRIRAHFHLDYLKEMLGERRLTYSKQQPGAVQEQHYLKSLAERHEQTGHIQSFGRLMLLWRSLGGDI
jgi:hypothetical protein